MGIDDEGEPCDFCEIPLGEDENFTEVRLGPLPQPERIRLEKTGSTFRNEDRRQAKRRLAVEAIDEHPQFEVEMSDSVEEVTPVGGEKRFAVQHGADLSRTQFETEVRDDKIAAGIMVFPEPEERDPDAQLCPRCATMFD
jgi:hypothetical protein